MNVWCNGVEWMVTITGYIHVQNDVTNTAIITEITESVEAKYKGNPWQTLNTVSVNIGDGEIAPGATEDYSFTITFAKGSFTAYRNVASVWLANYPDGLHEFVYRLSFDVP